MEREQERERDGEKGGGDDTRRMWRSGEFINGSLQSCPIKSPNDFSGKRKVLRSESRRASVFVAVPLRNRGRAGGRSGEKTSKSKEAEDCKMLFSTRLSSTNRRCLRIQINGRVSD